MSPIASVECASKPSNASDERGYFSQHQVRTHQYRDHEYREHYIDLKECERDPKSAECESVSPK